MVLNWALQGPLKGPWDFRDSARLCLPFLKNTFSKPFEHHGTRIIVPLPKPQFMSAVFEKNNKYKSASVV